MKPDQAENDTRTPPPGFTRRVCESPPSVFERRFGLLLGGLLLVALLSRLVILYEFLQTNPLARVPVVDAATYWRWADRIAGGALVGETPFLSAPLYPYLLGLIRALGGGLLTVYVIQLVLHLATAAILTRGGRIRFGPGTGLLAAALFLGATEPAFASTRVLASTLQLLLIALLWVQLLRLQERATPGGWVLAGVLLGLNCLASPPMLVLLVGGPAWAALQPGSWRRRAAGAGALAFSAAAVVALAPVHNYLVCGEFIPLTAHSGITFRQGNAPGAKGAYTAIPGISMERDHMHRDAAGLYEERTGRPARWVAVDAYFRSQGFEYWRADPWRAVKLAGRKLHLFLTGRNFGDVYYVTAEIKRGLATWLGRLAPVPTPWLIGPALIGFVVMARRPIRYGPEFMLFVVPLLVVVAFWYSPRYRIPAVPVIVVAAAWALTRAAQWRAHRWWSVAVLVALVASVASGPLNRFVEVEAIGSRMSWLQYQLGYVLEKQSKLEEAIVEYRRGLPGPASFHTRARLGWTLSRLGRIEEACEEYRLAHRAQPGNVRVAIGLADALLSQRLVAEAESVLQAAATSNARDPRVQDLLTRARDAREEVEASIESHRRMLAANPEDITTRVALGREFQSLRRLEEAGEEFAAVLERLPTHFEAQYEQGRVLVGLGQAGGARAAFEAALRIHPQDMNVLYDLAGLHLRQGRPEQAATCLRQVLAVDADYRNARGLLRLAQESTKRRSAGGGP